MNISTDQVHQDDYLSTIITLFTEGGILLLFAVPKKGRLQQACLDLLAGSDIQFRRENRLDIALVKNLPIALIFLPAADIPTFVGDGRVDLGITGQDVIAEHDAHLPFGEASNVQEIMNLGFGRCKLQVQVPEKGNFHDVQDLIGKNVCTSFTGLSEDYFSILEEKKSRRESLHSTGFQTSESSTPTLALKTRIKYLGGSVEAACALGVADAIVDLVESGETMRAAGLKAIATVLESSAVLIKSKTTNNEKLVNLITARIQGVITAQRYVYCQYNVSRATVPIATKITPGKRAPTITGLEEPEWVAVSVMVDKKEIATVMDQLTDVGATDILVMNIGNSRGC